MVHKLHLSIDKLILNINFVNLFELRLITVNDNKVVFIILNFILRILIIPIHYHSFNRHNLEWFMLPSLNVLLKAEELVFQKVIFFVIFKLWFLPKWN